MLLEDVTHERLGLTKSNANDPNTGYLWKKGKIDRHAIEPGYGCGTFDLRYPNPVFPSQDQFILTTLAPLCKDVSVKGLNEKSFIDNFLWVQLSSSLDTFSK